MLKTVASCREVSQFTSTIMSAAPIFGATAALYTHEEHSFLGKNLDGTYAGWDTSHKIPEAVHAEIQFWIDLVASDPSRPLWTAQFQRHVIAATDASATGMGGTCYTQSSPHVVAAALSEDQIKESSTHREVYAAQLLHKVYTSALASESTWTLVTHLLDSTSAKQILMFGTSLTPLLKIAKEMDTSARQAQVMVNYVWHPREDTLAKHADLLSRLAENDIWDYEITFKFFHQIAMYIWKTYHLAPAVDLFASHTNTKCPLFFSLFMQPGSLGPNVLLQQIPRKDGGFYYACPPVPLIPSFLKLLPLKSPVLLIIPDFKKSVYMSTLFPEREKPRIRFDVLQSIPASFFRSGPVGNFLNNISNASFRVLFIHSQAGNLP